MGAKRVILTCLTAAALTSPAFADASRADGLREDGAQTLVEAVREATAHFRDVDAALAAGYQPFQGCVSGPEEGAMGVHLVNFSLFDGAIDVKTPEALVYEPRNGRLHLVAVEYIAPAVAWEGSHPPGVMPSVSGHLFHFAPGPNRYGPDAFYELHVWAWKLNPNGTFADWNPRVSCASYSEQSAAPDSSHGH